MQRTGATTDVSTRAFCFYGVLHWKFLILPENGTKTSEGTEARFYILLRGVTYSLTLC